MAPTGNRWVWRTEDLRNAFDEVPQRRLLDILRLHIPDERMKRLIERVVLTETTRGLRQGGNLSPLLLNVYLDHLLDKKWSRHGPNLLLAECPMRKAAELQTEVAGNSPSPLEQLLAENVAVCWLQVSFYDSLIAQTREYTPAKVRMLQQQHDGAHRRYLAAIKTLATVRKLLVPSRSPVEIATKLAGERSGLRLRQAPVEAGVPVAN